MSKPKTKVKRVVLAYSGGLDTSIILKWLQTTYGCEVVTFTADLGQGDELEPARRKAELLGVKPEHIFIEDLREEFVRDYVFPMFRANAQYEGQYLLGTSIARPLIAKRLVEIARAGRRRRDRARRTGKGNDQVRFELSAYALEPEIKIIAPWREWDFASRTALSPSPSSTRFRSPRTSAAKRRSPPTPISCTSPPRARCSKTPRWRRRAMSIRAPSIRNRRPTSRPSSRSRSRREIRSRSTASASRPRRCSPRSTSSATTTRPSAAAPLSRWPTSSSRRSSGWSIRSAAPRPNCAPPPSR